MTYLGGSSTSQRPAFSSKKNNWPQKHQQALALFFTLITNHEHRMRPRGEKSLLRYAGFVRREWHDRLAQDQGFNIGLFNNALYNSISEAMLLY
jgi:hypothetical protein